MSESTIVAAHYQEETITVRRYYPDHEPRADDPLYHYFTAARKRLHDAGKLVCWVCGQPEGDPANGIQLHHTMVEFSLQNEYDIARFAADFPEFGIVSDEDFFRWVEQDEHNLTPLCVLHHTGLEGIHLVDHPTWQAIKYEKRGLPPAGAVILPTPTTHQGARR